jgi:hypothetical protein
MENAFPEKGTIEILRNSEPEFSSPDFNEQLMKRIVDERNWRIRMKFWLNYSIIAIAISVIIFLIIRALLIAPPFINETPHPPIGGSGFGDYGFFVLPLVALYFLKKLFDRRIKWR